MASKIPLSISGYTILPLEFPPLPSFPKSATHYLYIHPHDPRQPDPDSSRSLFVVNVPINTTKTHFQHLFGTQLSAGRVERVEFHDAPAYKPVFGSVHTKSNTRKRKRTTAEDLHNELRTITLPQTWDRKLHPSGSHAVVVFADRLSMESSLKAAKKAARDGVKIVWGDGVEDRLTPLGPQRYQTHKRLQYPPTTELLHIVDEYMTIFSRFEEAQSREASKKAQEPDEDGFVTVTRGPKMNSVARDEEMKSLIEKHKERSKGLEDFYRFQMRNKRKERQGELLKQFEEDKKKVEEMKKRRGKLRPE